MWMLSQICERCLISNERCLILNKPFLKSMNITVIDNIKYNLIYSKDILVFIKWSVFGNVSFLIEIIISKLTFKNW